jgi:hypothetical protein
MKDPRYDQVFVGDVMTHSDDRQHRSILQGIARRAMIERELLPDFPLLAVAGSCYRSSKPTPQQHRLYRLEDDDRVQQPRHVLDVEQVVLELFDGVLDRVSVAVMGLRPPGNAGLDRVA